jgi:protein TonB
MTAVFAVISNDSDRSNFIVSGKQLARETLYIPPSVSHPQFFRVSKMKKQILSALVLSAMIAPVALTAPAAANNGPSREAVELVAPEYPRGAERRGIEGTVRVEYSISAAGEVVNATVVAANPEGVFDRAALAAIENWRYAPADAQTDGHSRELEFRLAN